MKCITIWVNDDGAAQIAELPPELGQSLINQVDAQPAESAEQAIEMLRGMIDTKGANNDEEAMQGMMRGYGKPKQTMAGGLSAGKVFGDD